MKTLSITTDILKEVATEKVQLHAVDTKQFFKTGDGIYVWSSFVGKILPKAKKSAAKELELSSWQLLEDSYNKTIESAFGEGKHLFSETEVCAIIATLIEKQKGGKKGLLLNDESWNLFYTKSFVVCVSWRSVVGRWVVDAWSRGGSRWDGGLRVFSPATAA